nr:MAG TPA: hypothetical protein [Caudoviricetes sp.]
MFCHIINLLLSLYIRKKPYSILNTIRLLIS